MVEIPIGRRTVISKKYKEAIVGIVDMGNDMWAVVVYSNKDQVLFSRSFLYTDATRKSVWEACRQSYKIVKEYVYQKKFDELEDIE